MNKKVVLGLVAIVVLAAGIFLSQGDLFKGEFFGNQSPNKPVDIKVPTEIVGDKIISFPSNLLWKDGGDPDNGPQKIRNYEWKVTEISSGKTVWERKWHDKDQNISWNKNATCKGLIPGYPNAWTCDSVKIPDGILEVGKTYKFSVEAGDGIAGSGYAERVLKVASSHGVVLGLNASYGETSNGFYKGVKLDTSAIAYSATTYPESVNVENYSLVIYKSTSSPVEMTQKNILLKLPKKTTDFWDKNVENGKTYYYAMSMNKTDYAWQEKIAVSDEVSVTIPKVQAKEYLPIQLSNDMKYVESGKVRLIWSDLAGSEEGAEYDIYRSTKSPVELKLENIVGKHFYDSKSLKAGTSLNGQNDFPPGPKGTTYYYVVKINAPGAENSKSNELKVVLK